MSLPLLSLKLFRSVLVLALATLIGSILYASQDDDVWTGLVEVAAIPWGTVTLVDLSVGLAFAGAWMVCVVGPRRAAPWIVGLVLLGNVSLLIFLTVRSARARDWRAILSPRSVAPRSGPRSRGQVDRRRPSTRRGS